MSEPTRATQVPHLSVVIPVYNNPDGIDALLAALAAQEGVLPPFEVVVVDNASVPPLEILSTYGLHVRLVLEPRAGRALARNAGIRAAQGDRLAFIDSDCLPMQDWLQQGLRALDGQPSVSVIAGRVDVTVEDPRHPTAVERFERHFAFDIERYVRVFHYGGTGNLFTRREAFDQVGLFDESLNAAEDVEWGNRAYDAGLPLIYDDDVIVSHAARRTFREMARKVRRQMGGAVLRERKRRAQQNVGIQVVMVPLRVVRRLTNAFLVPWLRLAGYGHQPSPPPVREWLPILAVLYFVQATIVIERIRLALGGSPAR